MRYVLKLDNAGNALENQFRQNIIDAESVFKFPSPTDSFMSVGITAVDEFDSELDGDPVIRSFRSMTIGEGHIVRPKNRCKGMYLYISGDLVVNGLLTMTARGAKAQGKYVGIDPKSLVVYHNPSDIFQGVCPDVIGPKGGPGGAATYNKSGTTTSDGYSQKYTHGLPGINGACGGGGSGISGASWGGSCYSGSGADGTSFSGGSGGGGVSIGRATGVNGGAAQPDGGAGGAAAASKGSTTTISARTAGGGAGNPGGAGAAVGGGSGGIGQSGTGGLLILVVKGSIIFGPNGRIESCGSLGGIDSRSIGQGGGSGGGAIHIFTSNPENIDQSKISVAGGGPLSRGGNGSIVIMEI